MSDEVITPEMIELTKKYNITLEDASKFAKAYGNTAAEAAKKAELAFKSTTDAVQKAYAGMKDLYTNSNKASDSFASMKIHAAELFVLTTQFNAFSHMGVDGGKHIDTMGDSLTELTTKMGGWANVVDKYGGVLGKLGKGGLEVAQQFLAHADQAQHLENAYINLQGASGNLGNVFNSDGTIVGNLSGKIQQYGIELANTRTITGENIKTIAEFSSKLGTIPNVLNTMVKSGNDANRSTNAMAMALTLAKGAGRGNEEVLSAMKIAYENLGNAQGPVTDNAQKGIEMFALMSEASTKLKLRFSDTSGYLTSVADDFKMIGDNTQGATNVLSRFSGALQNTGLTAKSSVSVIQAMVKSMGNLEMGTKALISARSGGPGGLQGAFQVENLLREGKVDKVAEMLENSFKQQAGGRIYTQKEAGESPQAAAQFMRQREMLKSGAFGSMAKDDASASRLLEAMAAGPTETAKTLKNSLDATTSVAEQGTNLQKQQVDILQILNSSIDRGNIIANQTFLATARMAIGTGREDKGKEELIGFMDTARQNIKQTVAKEAAPTKEGVADIALEQYNIGAGQAADAIKILPRRIMDIVADIQKPSANIKNNKIVQQGQRQSLAAEARSAAQPYLSLFKPTVTAKATTLAARQAQTQTPQRLRAALPTQQQQQQQQQNTLQPREIILNVKLAEGLEAEVENTGDRAGSSNAGASVFNGGFSVQVNK